MKTLQNVALSLFCALFVMSCGHEKPQPETTDDGPPEVSESKIIIPLEEAEQLFDNYGERRVTLIEKSENVDDNGEPIDPDSPDYVRATTSLSIDYAQLKQYLAFVEQEASAAQTDITGLRIYFGLYGENGINPNAETVFLNPIMEHGKKGNIRDDVSFAIVKTEGESKAVPVGDILDRSNDKEGTDRAKSGETVQSLASDDFPWRPPPTGNSDF